jgi:hypothetical protein
MTAPPPPDAQPLPVPPDDPEAPPPGLRTWGQVYWLVALSQALLVALGWWWTRSLAGD